MNALGAIGATCLGVVIGWLTRYFIQRFNRFTPMHLSSVVSIILGSAVMAFLGADKSVWWFYPIGLLLGFVLYSAIAVRAGAPPPKIFYHAPGMMEEHLNVMYEQIVQRRRRLEKILIFLFVVLTIVSFSAWILDLL